MSKIPFVSIIIDNYNYGRFLGEAIDSALNQTHPNIEVIVVDDGSTDNSRSIIFSYNDRIVPVLKENGGQGSAFNTGFRASRGEIVIFLDSDDTLLPTAVEKATELFSDPGVVKVHWPLWRIDAYGRKTGEVTPNRPLIEGDLRDLVIRYGPLSYDSPPYSPPTSGNAWSRRFLGQVLPMPESEYVRGADAYLFTLSSIFGQVRRLVEPQGCYRIHGSNDTLKPLEEYMVEFFDRYDHCCLVLSRYLQEMGIDVDPIVWQQQDSWFHQIRLALQEIETLVPRGENFILVDENQWGAGNHILGRQRIPFIERDGEYWGPPADDATAIREVERLQQSGAHFMVFAWPTFWWLEHYAEFHRHLRTKFRCLLENDRLVVFNLRS